MDDTNIERETKISDEMEIEQRIALMDQETEIERSKLEKEAIDGGFELAMRVRSYLGTLHEYDTVLRSWVLSQLEQQLPKFADKVIAAITKIEDIDYFEEHGFPR